MSKDVCTHLQYLHNLRDSREILHSLFFALTFLCLGYRSLFYIRHYSSRNPSKPIKNYMFGLFFRVKKITETKILVEFTVLPKRKTYWNWKPIGVHFLVKRHSISCKKGELWGMKGGLQWKWGFAILFDGNQLRVCERLKDIDQHRIHSSHSMHSSIYSSRRIK